MVAIAAKFKLRGYDMEIKEQEKTFAGFVKLTKYSVAAGVVLMIVLAIVYKI